MQVVLSITIRIWGDLRRVPLVTTISLLTILLYLLVTIFAPLLAPYTQNAIVGGPYEFATTKFWFGTDNLGRDMLSRMIYGARNTIGIAIVTTTLSFLVGAGTGFIAAIAGGWVDQLLARLVDVLMAIPKLIFALLILTIIGSSIVNLILIVALLDAPRLFRVSRSVAMNVVAMDFVEVARLRGEGYWWMIRREILPNAFPPLIVELGIRFALVFLFISSLGFLGLGVQPPTADWGTMVRDNAMFITFGGMTALLPAAAIAILALAINIVVDWIVQISSHLKD